MTIHFSKYHGTGNDFIIIDGRAQKFDLKNYSLISKMCHRKFGIGADGLMVLEKDSELDFKMIYFNSDGFEGTMCGNGGRCICAFASSLGIINNETKFISSDGIHEAYFEKEIIHLKMKDVSDVKKLEDGFLINTGSPHFITLQKNPHALNVELLGKEIRNQKRFAPDGVNVNFVERSENNIHISTFERGVEAETLSCGTGSVASALAFAYSENDGEKNFNIMAKGGNLNVRFHKTGNSFHNIWLSGPAIRVFDGEFDTET